MNSTKSLKTWIAENVDLSYRNESTEEERLNAATHWFIAYKAAEDMSDLGVTDIAEVLINGSEPINDEYVELEMNIVGELINDDPDEEELFFKRLHRHFVSHLKENV